MNGAGTFASGTGAVLLYGHVSIATDKDLHMTFGSGTLASGTGAVLLYGYVSIATDKDLP